MSIIKSSLNTRSDDYKANVAAMQALVDDLVYAITPDPGGDRRDSDQPRPFERCGTSPV